MACYFVNNSPSRAVQKDRPFFF